LLATSPVLAVPGTDFDFYRADNDPTDFHTETYNNNLTGENAEAFQEFVNTEASSLDLSNIQARKLDPNNVYIKNAQEIKVYFIKEETSARNQILVSSSGSSLFNGSVLDDLVCLSSGCNQGPELTTPPIIDSDAVLELGDYVSLGNVLSGSHLGFSLKQGDNTYGADPSSNPDGIQHLMAYEYEGYLVLSFEDAFGGGDFDYNDAVIAVEIGQDNLDCIPTDGEAFDPNCGVVFAD